MTWEQFVGAALGLALVALGRLLDKYLPSSHDPEVATVGGGGSSHPDLPENGYIADPQVTPPDDGSTMPPEAQ